MWDRKADRTEQYLKKKKKEKTKPNKQATEKDKRKESFKND
tara:strand:- start:158 stop:280 length:123 start_codon:yes stop_codon:yes gene_type:complete